MINSALRPKFKVGRKTVYDIIIALFSGFAGAYALVDEKIGSALPGVAFATVLVPPLASCGICLALQQWELAGGAFLLFLVNFLAIELAAAITYWIYGLVELPVEDRIDPQTRLIIRSVLGADSTSDWYLGNYNDPVLDLVTD